MPTPPSLLSTPSTSPQRGSSPSSNNFSSCPILSEIQPANKPTNSTPIPITRNSNPSPTPPPLTNPKGLPTPTGRSCSRPSSPPPPRPSSPPPPLPPSHSSPSQDKSAGSFSNISSSTTTNNTQDTEKPERTVVRRVSVEKDIRRE